MQPCELAEEPARQAFLGQHVGQAHRESEGALALPGRQAAQDLGGGGAGLRQRYAKLSCGEAGARRRQRRHGQRFAAAVEREQQVLFTRRGAPEPLGGQGHGDAGRAIELETVHAEWPVTAQDGRALDADGWSAEAEALARGGPQLLAARRVAQRRDELEQVVQR